MSTGWWILIIFVVMVLTMTLALMMASKRIDNNLNQKSIGTIKMDTSDPDSPPYLFMELEHDGMERLQQSEYVIMKVDLSGYLK
jgi:hypothetical protein